MRRRLLTIVYSVAFLLLAGAKAQGQYVRPPSDPPTDSDLLAYDGQEKTVIIQIINATPYDIYLKDTHFVPTPSSTPPPPSTSTTVTAADQTEMLDKDRHNEKSFMFAPTGIPWYIPGAPIEAFHNPDENYRNTFTKPFTMAVTWDDHGGFLMDNWVKWTVNQVEYCTKGHSDEQNKWICEDTRHGDVDLGMWMYRIQKQPDKVDSVFFPPFVKTFFAEAVALAGLVTDPLNPLSWISMALATSDLAEGDSEFMKDNAQADEGNKLYLASYVVPADTSFCAQVSHTGTADCNPALMALRRNTCTSDGCTETDKTGDAVASKWEADAAGACNWAGGCPTIGQGPAFAPEAELVVTVHLLRSQPTPHCVPANDPYNTNPDTFSCPLGRLNLYTVTILRPTEFAVSALSGGSTTQATTTPLTGTTLAAAAPDTLDSDDEADVAAATKGSDDPATAQRRRIRHFLLQAGAGPLRHTLKQQGLSGLLALRSVVQDYLNLQQRQQLHQMVNHMLADDRPTNEERELVKYITRQFETQLKANQGKQKSK